MSTTRSPNLRSVHGDRVSQSHRANSTKIEYSTNDLVVSWCANQKKYRISTRQETIKTFSVINKGKKTRTREQAFELAKQFVDCLSVSKKGQAGQDV